MAQAEQEDRDELEEQLGAGRKGNLLEVADEEITLRHGKGGPVGEEAQKEAGAGMSSAPEGTQGTAGGLPVGRYPAGGALWGEIGDKRGRKWAYDPLEDKNGEKGAARDYLFGNRRENSPTGRDPTGRGTTGRSATGSESTGWGSTGRPYTGRGPTGRMETGGFGRMGNLSGDDDIGGQSGDMSRLQGLTGGLVSSSGMDSKAKIKDELGIDAGGDGGRTRKPAVMPSSFDGTGDLEEFLAHFDLCVLANGWSGKEAGTFLGISLEGVARRLLASVQPASGEGYQALRGALVERFQPASQVESYKALLRTRVRKAEEPLQNLSEEVSRLVRLAYPDADAGTVDTVAKDRFIDSLEDAELKHWIYQGNPKSLTAAVQTAVMAETYLMAERTKTHRVRGTTKTMAEEMEALKLSLGEWMQGKMGSWMEDISKKLDKPPQAPQGNAERTTGSRAAWNKGCFECGSEAHFKKECPQWLVRVEKAKAASGKAPAGN